LQRQPHLQGARAPRLSGSPGRPARAIWSSGYASSFPQSCRSCKDRLPAVRKVGHPARRAARGLDSERPRYYGRGLLATWPPALNSEIRGYRWHLDLHGPLSRPRGRTARRGEGRRSAGAGKGIRSSPRFQMEVRLNQRPPGGNVVRELRVQIILLPGPLSLTFWVGGTSVLVLGYTSRDDRGDIDAALADHSSGECSCRRSACNVPSASVSPVAVGPGAMLSLVAMGREGDRGIGKRLPVQRDFP